MAGGAFRLSGAGQQELVHVSDETWIAAPPALVGAAVAAPGVWDAFWPGLAPRLLAARGDEGVRVAVGGGSWHGSAELYVHAEFEGAVLFHFLRLDLLPGRALSRRAVRSERERVSRQGLAAAWALKDELEGRPKPRR